MLPPVTRLIDQVYFLNSPTTAVNSGRFLCFPQLSREARDHPEASLGELGLHRGQGPGVRCWMSLSQLVRSLCLLITSVCELSDHDNLDK